METNTFTHHSEKYSELFGNSKELFLKKDRQSLVKMLEEISSLSEQGLLTRVDVQDLTKLINSFLDALTRNTDN